ncbi:hypothetical protein JTE90_027186 [Oedothorax gibbosus]|uniref:Uncharacterized protein n=1 Tax=Oedothorax gibbosus TaxID=931172 RepID=A0AAV6TH47_9ARAC|nr:hypothetical protein JTE90_027186 [Oedothorax gibbosus]
MIMICLTCKETHSLELEEFLSSLSSKKDENSSEEIQEISDISQDQLLKIAKRSGMMAQPQPISSNDALSNEKLLQMLQQLQSMNNKQQNLPVYSPEYVQPLSQMSKAQRSPRALDSSQSSNINGNNAYSYLKPNSMPLTQDQQSSIQSQQQTQYRYNPQYTATAIQKHTSQAKSMHPATSNQREINKEDRQGHYPYESQAHDSGYSYGHGQARSPVYAHESQYSHPEPVHKSILPIPQLSIKFDPLGLLKLLLSGLPRPLFNLNGKIFLGLELGKGAGLTVGAGPAPHYGGSKNLITIG